MKSCRHGRAPKIRTEFFWICSSNLKINLIFDSYSRSLWIHGDSSIILFLNYAHVACNPAKCFQICTDLWYTLCFGGALLYESPRRKPGWRFTVYRWRPVWRKFIVEWRMLKIYPGEFLRSIFPKLLSILRIFWLHCRVWEKIFKVDMYPWKSADRDLMIFFLDLMTRRALARRVNYSTRAYVQL